MLTYSIVILIFHPLFGCPTANIRSLSRGQPYSRDVNHRAFISFWLKGHWKPHNNEFLKTWDGLQTDSETYRLTDTYANWWTQKSKNLKKKKKKHCLLSILIPRSKYLYYSIYKVVTVTKPQTGGNNRNSRWKNEDCPSRMLLKRFFKVQCFFNPISEWWQNHFEKFRTTVYECY